MKIFKRDDKTNFVDDNNVLVGFDSYQCCCENFGWSLTREFPSKLFDEGDHGIDLEGYQFDKSYYKSNEVPNDDSECAYVTFRLVNGMDEIFLTLWNPHNGYYSHGFDMSVGGQTIYTGQL